MDDFLQGFLPVAAILMALAFAAFVRHFVLKELRRRKSDDTDMAGAPEGDLTNHREVTK
ncbi:hypothetical protein [Rhizobium rhizogenes]|uniref:hypothetical protein n=1 Tax=Rhizobium rhizogenes TaxID=359 RepID=UPI00227196F5|nr:hypothetical protein [Rhizobium rhizogenes]